MNCQRMPVIPLQVWRILYPGRTVLLLVTVQTHYVWCPYSNGPTRSTKYPFGEINGDWCLVSISLVLMEPFIVCPYLHPSVPLTTMAIISYWLSSSLFSNVQRKQNLMKPVDHKVMVSLQVWKKGLTCRFFSP